MKRLFVCSLLVATACSTATPPATVSAPLTIAPTAAPPAAVSAPLTSAPTIAPTAAPRATPTTSQPTIVPSTAPPATPSPTPAPTEKKRFPLGLYISKPALDHPGGTIELLETTATLPTSLDFVGVGFDVSPDLFISAQSSMLFLIRPDGSRQTLQINGLYGIGRPSLSPDSKQVLVQGSDKPRTIGPTPPPVGAVISLDTVWTVDLATLAFRRIGDVPTANPIVQSEMTAWFPSGDRVAYWTIENDCLVIKVRDVASAKDTLTIRRNGTTGCYQPQRGILDGTRFHVAVSADSSKILIPGQMQVYDAKTGALVADIHQKVLDGLAAAGYKPDARFPGQAGGGTFPLDGTFGPDGKTIAFDGAVEKAGAFGILVCKINVDGTGFTFLRGPIEVTPKFSNNHNFSQVLPHWR